VERKKVVLLAIDYDFPHTEEVILVSPPLGILALGSYLVAHDIPVELIDVQMDFGFGLTYEAERIVCQRVAQYLHDQADAISWIGISQLTNAKGSITLAQEIHAALPEFPIIFGGFFPSSNFRYLLEQYPFITAVVRGDGEATALQISQDLAEGRSFLSDRTQNLAWIDRGEIRTTPIQPAVLDDLPIFDFRLLRNISCYPHTTMITSRGCPFHCNYCFESQMRPYTAYPAEWVDRQLTHIDAELSNRNIYIVDPIFGVGRQRTLEVCEIMRQHPFIYYFESRVDVLTPDLIPPLREAGVEFFYLGFESASLATLVRMNKVPSEAKAKSYLKDTLAVLKACFENNVTPFLGFMLGFPGDTEADLRASLEFVKEASRLHSQIVVQAGMESGFVPFPQTTSIHQGTPLADDVEKDFPEVVFRTSPFEERIVLSPSPGVDRDMINHYLAQIESLTTLSPVLERWKYSFSAKDFVASHPELTDDQGVTVFCDRVRRSST
jgi:radical SAM superfamily enzyme YgiQ (UPF0313 family)